MVRSPDSSKPRFRSVAEAERYLLGFVNYERLTDYRPDTRSHDLVRFERLLRVAGWRPEAVPTIHIGGTNAKGTVATLTERVLRAGGQRTGLYTSPHLVSIRERVRLDGRPIGARAFTRGVESLARTFGGEAGAGFRTTFEHLTGLAFLAFQHAGVDRAVVEVGLGGRLDATNILPPGLVVLTPVALDHRNILGDTVGVIAADKAHIVKPGGTAFVMPQLPEARNAILARAVLTGAEVIRTEEAFRATLVRADGTGAVYHLRGARDYGQVRTRLLGAHQARNLEAVLAVAERCLSPQSMGGALRGLRAARVAGRLDLRSWQGRPVLMDGGHNPHAGRAVADALRLHFPGARICAVVGMARDKEHAPYLGSLAEVVDRFVFTRSGNPRAAEPEDLARHLPGARTAGGLEAALGMLRDDPCDLILVAGSFILAGEALGLIRR